MLDSPMIVLLIERRVNVTFTIVGFTLGALLGLFSPGDPPMQLFAPHQYSFRSFVFLVLLVSLVLAAMSP